MADREWGVGNVRTRIRDRVRARKIVRLIIYLPASLIRGATLFSTLYFQLTPFYFLARRASGSYPGFGIRRDGDTRTEGA